MRRLERYARSTVVLGACGLAVFLAHQFGTGGLWHGFNPSLAVALPGQQRPYDLTRLEAVNETLKYIRDRYVDPDRVKPRNMLMSALNYIQRDVAQVIVLPDGEDAVTVRVDTHDQRLRIDNVLGPWDVAAKLREVFAFLQKHLKDSEVDLREIEYAACNGLLKTLDPHSVFLSPDAYREMNLSTSGQFGGLGIVISIRDQLLTVMKPMPDTPAGRAGLKRYDRIVKIGNESTLNMPLDDAVRRLRGKPGTTVSVWIEREGPDGWPDAKKFDLTRERIDVHSVESQRLDDVAYIRLKQFQQTSTAEIRAAIADIRSKGPIRGLVLDLRNNPGGLLEQAANVSDLWLKSGVLVATVGASEGREEKRANAQDTEPDYPLVVLVSGSSASASEIVAGALRNLDRAVIVGQTTFGKGSVQLVFPDVTRDKAALKLTIAQYLTPGDKSIQGVGVTPHIELDPMTVDPYEMDLTVRKDGVRERDLSQSLSNSQASPSAKPEQVVRYYLPQEERFAMRERGGEIDDEFQVDFPIQFGAELVRRMPSATPASAQMRAVESFIEQAREDELAKVTKELGTYSVDWTLPTSKPTSGPTKDELQVAVKTDRPADRVAAGETINLSVTVTNRGTAPVYRLRAVTESDNPYFDEHELVFGKVGPGEARTATIPLTWCDLEGRRADSVVPTPKEAKRICKIPMDAQTRSDGVKIHFDAAGGFSPPTAELRPTIEALPRPLFQYSYQIADDVEGNGDGLVQRGEKITMYLTVKNVGAGRSYDSQANLANRSGDGLLLRGGRFDISDMKVGDVRRVAFTFDVEPQLQESEVVLSLSVGDRDLREFVNEKIKLPIAAAVSVTASTGAVEAKGDTLLYADALAGREPFGRVVAGTTLATAGTSGSMVKVRLDEGRFAFVRSGDVVPADKGPTRVPFEELYSHAPPALTVAAASMATRGDTVKVKVEATDTERLLDVYLFVGQRKLHYLSNRQGADPHRASFEFDAPLRPGVNLITVVARENADTTTRRTVVVRRDAPDGSVIKTPRDSDYLLEPDVE